MYQAQTLALHPFPRLGDADLHQAFQSDLKSRSPNQQAYILPVRSLRLDVLRSVRQLAKSRYCPELSEVICNAIAVYGFDEAGWKAGDISKMTFYRWINSFPEFCDAVKRARSEYQQSHRDNIKRLGNKAFLDYLKGNMTKVVHTKAETINPVTGEIVELEEWKTTPVGTPKWAIERALGEELTELGCLTRLAELNMLPIWVVDCAARVIDKAHQEIAQLLKAQLPEPLAYELAREREHSGGISEETFNRIRSQIMGIDSNDRPNTPAIKPEIAL